MQARPPQARPHITAALVALALVAAASPVVASPKGAVSVDAELVTMHATRERAIDPRRGKPRTTADPMVGKFPELARPPYDGFVRFAVLRRGIAILAPGMAWKTTLPSGRDLLIRIKDPLGGKKKRKADERLGVVASVGTTGTSDFATVLETDVAPGETFFIPADEYRGGLLVVQVRVLPP